MLRNSEQFSHKHIIVKYVIYYNIIGVGTHEYIVYNVVCTGKNDCFHEKITYLYLTIINYYYQYNSSRVFVLSAVAWRFDRGRGHVIPFTILLHILYSNG